MEWSAEQITAVLVAAGSAVGLDKIASRALSWRRKKQERALEASQNEAQSKEALLIQLGDKKAELSAAQARDKDISARNDELSSRVQVAEARILRTIEECEAKIMRQREEHAKELADAMRLVMEAAERERVK